MCICSVFESFDGACHVLTAEIQYPPFHRQSIVNVPLSYQIWKHTCGWTLLESWENFIFNAEDKRFFFFIKWYSLWYKWYHIYKMELSFPLPDNPTWYNTPNYHIIVHWTAASWELRYISQVLTSVISYNDSVLSVFILLHLLFCTHACWFLGAV